MLSLILKTSFVCYHSQLYLNTCREVELLEIPSGAWRLSVFQWPSTLLANEVVYPSAVSEVHV